jgi:phosphopantetheinyl transferase
MFVRPDERADGWAASPLDYIRLWTLKEACLKLLGVGLAQDPLSLKVSRDACRLDIGDARIRLHEERKPGVCLAFAYLEG